MLTRYFIIIGFFLLSLVISSLLIRKGIRKLKGSGTANTKPEFRKLPVWFKDVGFWIGFFENVIIFIFVINKEFSALAIIFAAKEFVRKEDIKSDPTYYLLGTMINFGVSLILVEVALEWIKHCNL